MSDSFANKVSADVLAIGKGKATNMILQSRSKKILTWPIKMSIPINL